MSKKQDREYFWKHHYISFNKSGLTQREFCRQNELNYWSFNQWKRRFDKSELDVSLQEISLSLPEKSQSKEFIEIIFKNDIRLSIPDNFSKNTLKQIVEIFGETNEN